MAAFADDEVHVVLTARDLARQIPAEWQENVKHRGRRSFARFMGWSWRRGVPIPRRGSGGSRASRTC